MRYQTYADIEAKILDRLSLTDRNTDAERQLILKTLNAFADTAIMEEVLLQERARTRVLLLQERILGRQLVEYSDTLSQQRQQTDLLQRIARALETLAGTAEPDLIQATT